MLKVRLFPNIVWIIRKYPIILQHIKNVNTLQRYGKSVKHATATKNK